MKTQKALLLVGITLFVKDLVLSIARSSENQSCYALNPCALARERMTNWTSWRSFATWLTQKYRSKQAPNRRNSLRKVATESG